MSIFFFKPFIHVNRRKLALNWLAWLCEICSSGYTCIRVICYWPCGLYSKRMCYKRLWRTNKKSLFSFKRQSKITQQGGLWKRKWQNNSMCISICTRITQEKILELRGCKNASLCNKDIQVMYTRVYLGCNLQDQVILATFHWLSSFCVSDTRETILKLHWKMASVNSSKSPRFVDFLPSIRPSFLSVVLLFACGCLWVKNETTNGRLIALETRINMSPVVLVDTGCTTENSERTTRRPKEDSTRHLLKKIQRERKFSDTTG